MSLLNAIRNNDIRLLQDLLQNPNCTGNEVNIIGNTPLHMAIDCHYIDCVKLLLKKPGININVINNFGFTPIHKAAFHGNYKIVKMLLKNGAKVNIQCNLGRTPLFIACTNPIKNLQVIEQLLVYGADPSILTKEGDDIFNCAKPFVIDYITFFFLRDHLWSLWELD